MAPGPYFGRYVLNRDGDTPQRAARKMNLPVTVLVDLIQDRRSVDPDLAGRLAVYSHTTPNFWLSMQDSWDYTRSKLTPEQMLGYVQINSPISLGAGVLAPA